MAWTKEEEGARLLKEEAQRGHTEDAPTEMPRDREIPEGREEVRARADSRLYGGKAAEQGADGVIRLFAG